ncbi:MAG: hypothetical protein ABSF80_00520 [Chitinispirillaceae bacterium]|jgi:hypothetical protein
MRKRLMIFCVFALAAGLAMWTCSKKSNPSGPGGGDIGGGNTQTLTYYVSGTDIIATFPQEITTYSYCNGNSLVTENDTSPEYVSTMPYSISGNTLTLIQSTDTAYYDRSGTGSGLTGIWVVVSAPYGWPSQLDVTATTIVATLTNCYADDIIDMWNSGGTYADSAWYNVTVTKVSCSQVTLHGNVTNEQVTISFNSAGDATFTSTVSGHTAHTYYSNPTSCPNDYPDWYYTGFLDNNLKASPPAKRAVRPSVPRVKKHPVRW